MSILPEPDMVLVFKSKFPPSCGVVSTTTLAIPPPPDPVPIVTVKVELSPLVKVTTFSAAEAVVTKLAVAAFTDPDISFPI